MNLGTQVSSLTFALTTLVAVATASDALRVGVCELREGGRPAPNGLFRALDASERHEVAQQDSPTAALDELDVLVLLQSKPDSALMPGDRRALVEWVRAGRGLLAIHSAAGSGDAVLFPEVGGIACYPREASAAYQLEQGVVAGTCLLTQDHRAGLRYRLRACEFATFEPGAAGRVALRSVEQRDGKAISGAPLMVAGVAGKGRYVAYGAACRGVPPVSAESDVLLAAIDWLAGSGGGLEVADEIGEGVVLGPAEVDFAENGDVEAASVVGEPAPGWRLEGKDGVLVSSVASDNAASGKYSVRYAVPALGPDEEAPAAWTVPHVANGSSLGPDARDLYAVPPDSKCTVSFRLKGDPENATRPSLEIALYTWVEGRDTPQGIPYQKSAVVTEKWAGHSFDFFPRLDQVGRGLFVKLSLSPGQSGLLNPDSIAYIDDLSVTQSYGGIPKGLSIESVLAGCEEKVVVDWRDASSDVPRELQTVPAGTPIEYPEHLLARPMYDPLPEGWREQDLSGVWKVLKLPDTERNPTNDRGTVEGFLAPEYDDSVWPVRTVPSHWHSEDKPDPEGLVGWLSRMREDPNLFEGVGWYRTRFRVPEDFAGDRAVLVFEGFDRELTAFLNGVELGTEIGFDAPAEFDVTDVVKTGAENVLAVRLYDTASGIYIDHRYAVGGLFNRVVLQARPGITVSSMLINSRMEKACCEVDLRVDNAASQPRTVKLSASVTPDPDQTGCVKSEGRAFEVDLGTKALAPGLNELAVVLPMPDAVRWSCDDPFLYIVRFMADGEVIGKERFGFRDFKQVGHFLYLNGERVYLMGGPAPDFRGIQRFVENRDNLLRKAIISRQQLHHNCFMPRNSMQTSFRQMYDICDELGVLLYDWSGQIWNYEWPGDDWPGERWFLWRYNHPSVVCYTLSNEARKPDQLYWLNKSYRWLKEHDKQGRPICTTTGGAPKVIAPETDMTDAHLYPGDIAGHPLDMQGQVHWWNWQTWKYHGKNAPLLSYEMGANYLCPLPDKTETARRLLLGEPVNYRADLAKKIRSEVEDYQMPLGARWLTLYGLRRYCIDDYDQAIADGLDPTALSSEHACIRQRWCVKHVTEGGRRAGDLLQGMGYNWSPWNAFAVPDGTRTTGRSLARAWSQTLGRPLLAASCYEQYQRACNPTFVCTDPFDKNVSSGGKLKATVYAINDTVEESAPWAVRVVVRDADGKRLADTAADVGTVGAFKRKLFPYEWDIPAGLGTGLYGLELFMAEDGEVVSDNAYQFFVMNRDEGVEPFASYDGGVALYDSLSEDEAPDGVTTRHVLTDLGFEHTRIESFGELKNYRALIIGSRSVDSVVTAAAEPIMAWVREGGHLLVYEQVLAGYRSSSIPFYPKLSLWPSRGKVADIMAYEHPLFEGIRRVENWEKWNGEPGAGSLFRALVGPLNRTMLATACRGTPRSSNESVQMLVAEVREGKGSILFSQPEATCRYGRDCVATRYLRNSLNYILSAPSPYAQSLLGFEIVNVDPHRCGYLDTTAQAGGEADDVSAASMARMAEGLDECGGLAFRTAKGRLVSVLKAEMDLLGEPIEFRFRETSKLMFPEWEAEKRKQDTDQLGLILDRAEVIYILHRVKGMSALESIGWYLFTYADGTVIREEIIDGLNIATESPKKAPYAAKRVGDGFWVCRWVNPAPEKAMESVAVELTSETAELEIGGITTYLIRQKVHD